MDALVRTAHEVVPSVLYLRARIPESHPSAAILGEERIGSAIAVGTHTALTAHYLLLGAGEVELLAADGRTRGVERVGIDHETGLALATLSGPPLVPVEVASSETVQPGQPVFLLTCAGAGERKGASGHVTQVGPFEAFWEYMLERAIMTTMLNPGLAGGPLLDALGRLIGILSLGLAAVGRYSLAIPSELYLARREELLGTRERAGRVRAWLGFYPHAFDGGIVVTGVVPGGPAQLAGLVQGDLVLSLDGTPVTTLRELYRTLWLRTSGEQVALKVLRESAIRDIAVVAGDRDAFYR